MLIFVVGPPAVGKMAVGDEIARRLGLALFHNHLTIELLLRLFPHGSESFTRLNREIRQRILAEIADSSRPGVVVTYVWAFDSPDDTAQVESWAALFDDRGGRVLYVELSATLQERLRRNETAFRLAEKPSKRDLEISRAQLLDLEGQHLMNSGDRFSQRRDYLRIDNTALSAAEVAKRAIEYFGLTPQRDE